jgi:hypothetical protein
MTAIVSGQAGLVVLVNGSKCSCRRIANPEYQLCERGDIPYLFADASDVISIDAKSPEQAFRILEHEWANDRCLHLLLILLDRASHLYAKRLASAALEKLLLSETAQQFVLHRLYARPLPPSADPSSALALAQETGLKLVWGLTTRVREDQARITAVRARWDSIDPGVFGNFDGKSVFEQVVIEEGLFFALGHIEQARAKDLPAGWLTNPRFKEFENSEQVLMAWVEPFLPGRIEVKTATQLNLFDQDSLRRG